MMNTCGLRLFLVMTEPRSGGSDPQTPRRVQGGLVVAKGKSERGGW
jgi:hypothetical protein